MTELNPRTDRDPPGGAGFPAGTLTVCPVAGIPEIRPGDDLSAVLAEVLSTPGADGGRVPWITDGDVLVVTQKIVSKAEGQIVPLDPEDPDAKRRLIESESTRILRRRGDLLITETHHGFVCANAGMAAKTAAARTPPAKRRLIMVFPDMAVLNASGCSSADSLGFGDHGIAEPADALDLDVDAVAPLHP